MSISNQYRPDPLWLKLGEGYSDPVRAAQFPEARLRYRNNQCAEELGLRDLNDKDWIRHFGHFEPLPSNLPEPLALRYHGHQFTHYNPDLGDGRGFLYAQMRDNKDRLIDLGTKGSGRTPYSRAGDGRLTLKGAVREALATHQLEKLGVNTSRTLSVIETGESLERHDEPSPTRAAVLVRANHSHVRFGSFQRLAYFKESKKIESLIEYCIEHFYPTADFESFFDHVAQNVASTTAQWMMAGFVHGVLNTDNVNITGESFDYGPYRFLPHYDLKFTAAYFDHQGLYAYGRQPQMMAWNLERLKEALSSVITNDKAYERGFSTFQKTFTLSTMELFAKKVGILWDPSNKEIENFFYQCLQFLEKSKAPFAAFFHHLYCWHQDLDRPLKEYSLKHYDNSDIEDIEKSLGHLARDPEATEKTQDDFSDLLINEIEAIWDMIDKKDDWSAFHQKLAT